MIDFDGLIEQEALRRIENMSDIELKERIIKIQKQDQKK